jgi:acyl-CoA reductase-like NAD-dependent aldehyde dehydrogenase
LRRRRINTCKTITNDFNKHKKTKRVPSIRFPINENVSVEEAQKLFGDLKENFESHVTSKIHDKGRWDYAYRMKNIKGLIRFIQENEKAIVEAANKDIGRTSAEWLLEKMAMLADLRLIVKRLKRWMKPQRKETPLWMLPSSSFVIREPYGVVLVLGAWNYNTTLSLLPCAGALAAGNACVMKPSELSPNQALLLAQLLPRYVDPACFRVVLGDAVHSAQLVEHPWDFVFFTGSGRIGSKIAESCGRRLIPCALELGGKSPTIIDQKCDLTVTSRRIIQTKFVNCGQTCVAPDYLIVIGDENRKREVLSALDAEIKNQFGADASASGHYGKIVNEMHFKRIQAMLKNGTVFRGGQSDASKGFIEPTLMEHVDLESPLMQDEIFGPILPCVLGKFFIVDAVAQFETDKNKKQPKMSILQFSLFVNVQSRYPYTFTARTM